MKNSLHIRKVAVLGAGVMGAQIAAHLINAKIHTVLFELAADGGDVYANVRKSVENLKKLEPKPLATVSHADQIRLATCNTDLEQLHDCDLVIEAIAEQSDLKKALYTFIAPYLGEKTILATNTSGLSLSRLAQSLTADLQKRFCGIHFFNPPRYMHLIELVSGEKTDSNLLNELETFLTRILGKGVIRAKDTPNFIANRIGIFAMIVVMHHAQRLDLAFDLVDTLTGSKIGRPKNATFRTMDVIGLDTIAHVIKSSAQVLKDDPWQRYYVLPVWFEQLIADGAFGQKTRIGIYKQEDDDIKVLEPAMKDYRLADTKMLKNEIIQILKNSDWNARFIALQASKLPEAQFLWCIHRDVFHYAAYLQEQIADTTRDIDLALRWGFGWLQGPFEIWQAAGWQQVAGWIAADIANGKAMSDTPLPTWVSEIQQPHLPEGSWGARGKNFYPRRVLDVYSRQLFPECLVGEELHQYGETLFENSEVRVWHTGDRIAVLTFSSKMHVTSANVLEGIHQAIDIAEEDFDALIIWHSDSPFGARASLKEIEQVVMTGDFDRIDQLVDRFQQAGLRLRYAQVPTVAAVHGLVPGSGCELLMHCDRVVAALDSYIGLMDVDIGLIPAGGGCKAFSHKAMLQSAENDVLPWLKQFYETIAFGKVSNSAEEAKNLGFMRHEDIIVLNVHEILYIAKAQARAMAEANYRPPFPQKIRIAGSRGLDTLLSQLVNMRDSGFISKHDFLIGHKLAEVLCGGDIVPNTLIDEQCLLNLERRAFLDLLQTEKTLERMTYMLQNGKPLRN